MYKQYAGVLKGEGAMYHILLVDDESQEREGISWLIGKYHLPLSVAQAADAFFGTAEARVSVVVGQPPAEEGSAPPAAGEKHDALDDLLAFGAQFDNIKIQ